MVKKELICIGCPLGCRVTAEIDHDVILGVTGNTCRRGEDYARKELTNPTRNVTSIVRVSGGSSGMVSVKTRSDIPKSKMMEIARSLKDIEVQAPVAIGDVILKNAADTGVDIIATKKIARI